MTSVYECQRCIETRNEVDETRPEPDVTLALLVGSLRSECGVLRVTMTMPFCARMLDTVAEAAVELADAIAGVRSALKSKPGANGLNAVSDVVPTCWRFGS